MKTNWQKNIRAFLVSTFFQWFYVAIGVWVLIWRNYLSWEEIGLITSLGIFVSFILELPSGALADLIGRRKTIIFGRILGVIGFALYSVADSLPLFILGNILYHANWTFESGALSALLYDSLKENGKEKEHYQKTESDAFFYATLGMALASVIGGYLFKINIHLPYIFSTGVATLALISSFWLEEPTIDSEKFSLKTYISQNIDGIKHIFRHKQIQAVSIFSILISFIATIGIFYLYEPRLAEGGFPPEWLGWLVAGTYIVRAIGTKLIPFIMKLKEKYIPASLALLQTIGPLLSFFENKFGAISSVYVRKFSDGFRRPIMNRLQNEQIDSKYRATSLSAIEVFVDLLTSATGPIVGWMMQKYSVSFTFGVVGIFGALFLIPAALQVQKRISESS